MSPRVLVPAALTGVAADLLAAPGPLAVVAAGKAAAAMYAAFAAARARGRAPPSVAVGPHRPDDWAGGRVGHRRPSVRHRGQRRGRPAAPSRSRAGVGRDGRLVVLLSGGASALMAAPAHGLSLAVKQQTARTLMTSGAASPS